MPYAPAAALVLALAIPATPPVSHGPQSFPPQTPRAAAAPETRLAQQQGYTCSTPQGACALSYPAPVGSGCSCPIGGRPVAGSVQP